MTSRFGGAFGGVGWVVVMADSFRTEGLPETGTARSLFPAHGTVIAISQLRVCTPKIVEQFRPAADMIKCGLRGPKEIAVATRLRLPGWPEVAADDRALLARFAD